VDNLFILFKTTCNKFDKKDATDLKDTILIHDSLAFIVYTIGLIEKERNTIYINR
jgi:hypothetical protein